MALLFGPALVQPVAAQECPSPNEADFGALDLARVKTGAPRLNFTESGCTPSRTQTCRMRAYVTPGDAVVIGPVFDANACATYTDTKGRMTSGILPNDRLEAFKPPVAPTPAALVGTWLREEAEIKIDLKPGQRGAMAFEGEATYGAKDPERVKLGAVNTGSFEFDHTPMTNVVSVGLSMGAGGETVTVARKEAKEDDCQIAMIALGPYLIVEDNRMCGGLNVSFTGVYRKIARPARGSGR
jgi:hypothetical protein